MNYEEMQDILKAMKDGDEVLCQHLHTNDEYYSKCMHIRPNFHEYRYIRKPTPRTIWLLIDCDNDIVDTALSKTVAEVRMKERVRSGRYAPYTLHKMVEEIVE